MNKQSEYFLHARSMRADVLAAPSVWIPRREAVLEWLNGFMVRAEIPSYDLGETEAADLTALDVFLRKKKVPVAQG
jgi:hypothetical protein